MGSWSWRAARLMLAARLRAQLQFRASFVADLLGQAMIGVAEFVEIYVLLYAAPIYAGMNLAQTSVVYGLSAACFGTADMLVGQLDGVNRLIKDGRLEVLLTRPTSLLLQLVTQDVQLRRLGRALLGVLALALGLRFAHVAMSPAHGALLALAYLGGVLIFCAMFVFAACLLFFVLDGNQAANMFTYGGKYVSQVPGGALLAPIRQFFTFVVPATVVAYVPAAVLTGAPLPSLWWPGVAWLTVPIGLALGALMLGLWRVSIRHYTGAGG